MFPYWMSQTWPNWTVQRNWAEKGKTEQFGLSRMWEWGGLGGGGRDRLQKGLKKPASNEQRMGVGNFRGGVQKCPHILGGVERNTNTGGKTVLG